MIYRIPFVSECKVVTALGFKPKTPSSVVRYSIQLSYAASRQSYCNILYTYTVTILKQTSKVG